MLITMGERVSFPVERRGTQCTRLETQLYRQCPHMLQSDVDPEFDGGMTFMRTDAISCTTAEWLADLSERARAQGATERADKLLLLAWQAYDGQEITPDMLINAGVGPTDLATD